jgi:hypothetical protein
LELDLGIRDNIGDRSNSVGNPWVFVNKAVRENGEAVLQGFGR